MPEEVLAEKPKKKKDKVLIGLIICALIVGTAGFIVNGMTKQQKQKEGYLV